MIFMSFLFTSYHKAELAINFVTLLYQLGIYKSLGPLLYLVVSVMALRDHVCLHHDPPDFDDQSPAG